MDIPKTIKATVTKNIPRCFNNEYSESSVYLYCNFDCFYNKHNAQAWPIYSNNLWASFLERNEFDDKIATHCGFHTRHMMYKLHTQGIYRQCNNNTHNNVIISVYIFIHHTIGVKQKITVC